MKKHLSLILRIAVALAGLGYIAYILNWTDKVALNPPADSTQKAQVFLIISGDFDPRKINTPLTIRDTASGEQRVIQPAELGDAPGQYLLRPGIITTLRHANLKLLFLGFIVLIPIYPITAFRWWMLLRARGIEVPLWRAFSLCMVSSFFNYCMPGSTGGDVIKAYYAAKRSDRRADAVMTVIIDRIVGLLGLILLAGIAGTFMHSGQGLQKVVIFVWSVGAIIIFGAAFYFSRRLRHISGLDWLLTRILPPNSILAKVDQAAVAYSYHKPLVTASIILSMPVHLALALSASFAAFSLGVEYKTESLVLMLTVVPVLLLIAAVPISFQGVGTMEYVAFKLLLVPLAASPNQIVVMLMVLRLYQLAYSLLGAVFLLKGDVHLHPERDDKTAAEEPGAAVQGA